MNTARIAELYESLSAARRCLLKRLRRYTHDRNVRNLEESMKQYIEEIRREVNHEYNQRLKEGLK